MPALDNELNFNDLIFAMKTAIVVTLKNIGIQTRAMASTSLCGKNVYIP